jgi:hypothetical protein
MLFPLPEGTGEFSATGDRTPCLDAQNPVTENSLARVENESPPSSNGGDLETVNRDAVA